MYSILLKKIFVGILKKNKSIKKDVHFNFNIFFKMSSQLRGKDGKKNEYLRDRAIWIVLPGALCIFCYLILASNLDNNAIELIYQMRGVVITKSKLFSHRRSLTQAQTCYKRAMPIHRYMVKKKYASLTPISLHLKRTRILVWSIRSIWITSKKTKIIGP